MKPALLIILLLSVSIAAPGAVPSAVAIEGARVVPVNGPTIEKGTVVIRDGLIEAVGESIRIPPDAWVIPGQGLSVYPGLFDALSGWGIPKPAGRDAGNRGRADSSQPSPKPARGPEDRPLATSWIRAADLVKPFDKQVAAARNAGFTSSAVFPRDGIFGGQGAVVNLAGHSPGDMIVAPDVGEYLTFRTTGARSFPSSLMGTIAYIRQTYLDAGQYRESQAIYAANPAGLSRPRYDRALEGVLAAPRCLLPASRAVEIRRVLRLALELNQECVIYGGHEAYAAAVALNEAGTPVLVSLKWPERDKEADPEREDALRILEIREKAPGSPQALEDAGVKWAFYAGDVEKPADAIKAVRKALDAGLAPEAAVRAMTLAPAEIYGVADRLGSIETGKIANLIVTDGELFQEKTKVRHVFVDGVKFDPPEEPAGAGKEARQ